MVNTGIFVLKYIQKSQEMLWFLWVWNENIHYVFNFFKNNKKNKLRHVTSCGFIVAHRGVNDALEFLLIKSSRGHWGFPKGHMNQGESEMETAMRELKEETGITNIICIDDVYFETTYSPKEFGEVVLKTVKYFLGMVGENSTISIDGDEVAHYEWVTLDMIGSFTEMKDCLKEMLSKANEYLTS